MDDTGKKAKILIIEDDAFDAERLQLYLQQAGHQVVAQVSTGNEAITNTEHTEIDVMLVDIVLPGQLDGIDTVRYINEKHHIPAIFITGYTNEELLLRAEQVRPYAYLLKPVEQRDLELAINMCLARSQVEKELRNQKQKAEMQQQLAQKELLSQKAILQRVLENIPHAVFWKDRQSNYLGCNTNFARDAGLERPEQTISKNDYELPWKPEEAEFYRNVDQQVMESGQPQLNFEESIHKADGQSATLLTSKVPLNDDEGNIMGMLGIYTDITERKKQEEHLRQSQKMEALGNLTGGVAHDFNNMLGIILGYTDLLEEKLDGNLKLKNYMHHIRHAAERSTKLTHKLLAFSRKNIAHAEFYNMNSILQEQSEVLEKALTVRVKLNFDLSEDLWPVYLDRNDLEDAVLNMSINAMHAMEGSGELTIHTSNVYLDATEASALQVDAGDYIRLNITDTGCGIDDMSMERIFEPFYSTKGDDGTGFGLAQVYGFVERNNGAIKVESEPGNTVFSLFFPRRHEELQTDIVKDRNDPASIKGSETILIVDDEPVLLSISTEILKSNGYKTLNATNGIAALETLEREHVDLVLTDIIMPDMDGYQLARIVNDRFPDVAIQLASGYADDKNKDMVSGGLVENALQKPYQAQSLLRKVRQLLDARTA